MHDLLIRGGRVIDPAQGCDAPLDVAVKDGRIAALAPHIPAGAAKVVEAAGKVVAPGLVDLHAHVYRQGGAFDADALCGVGAGVTTLVDAGSAGVPDFADFLARAVRPSRASVYSFLYNHLWPSGYEPQDELNKDRHIEVDGIVALATRHPDIVKGVKVAVMPPITRKYGLEPVLRGREAARAAGLRVMLHIGDIGAPHLAATPPELTAEALDLLEPGDILTHLFCPLSGGGLDPAGGVLPALRAAAARGVILDAAMGDYQFGWAAAEAVLAAGLGPDVISSDIEVQPRGAAKPGVMVKDGRVTGARVASEMTLLEYMAYFFALGFELPEIIAMTTAAPARAAGLGEVAGSLAPGRPADIALLEVVSGRFRLSDVTGLSRTGTRALRPVLTIKAGRIHAPSAGPHPWGFTPPPEP